MVSLKLCLINKKPFSFCIETVSFLKWKLRHGFHELLCFPVESLKTLDTVAKTGGQLAAPRVSYVNFSWRVEYHMKFRSTCFMIRHWQTYRELKPYQARLVLPSVEYHSTCPKLNRRFLSASETVGFVDCCGCVCAVVELSFDLRTNVPRKLKLVNGLCQRSQ